MENKYMIIHASTEQELKEATGKLIVKLNEAGHPNARTFRYTMLVDIVNVIRNSNNPDEEYIAIVEY